MLWVPSNSSSRSYPSSCKSNSLDMPTTVSLARRGVSTPTPIISSSSSNTSPYFSERCVGRGWKVGGAWFTLGSCQAQPCLSWHRCLAYCRFWCQFFFCDSSVDSSIWDSSSLASYIGMLTRVLGGGMISFGSLPGTTPYKLVPVPGLFMRLVPVIICNYSVEYFTWKSSSLKSSIADWDYTSASRESSVTDCAWASSSIASFSQYPTFLEVGVSLPVVLGILLVPRVIQHDGQTADFINR